VLAPFTGTTAIRQCRGPFRYSLASGRSSWLILVPGGQIGGSCGMAAVPPLAWQQMARPAAMRLIFQLFLNFVIYFLFFGDTA